MSWTILVITIIDVLVMCFWCHGQNIGWGGLQTRLIDNQQGVKVNITYEQFHLVSWKRYMLDKANVIKHVGVSMVSCAEKCSEMPDWCITWAFRTDNSICKLFNKTLNQYSTYDAYQPTPPHIVYEKLVRNNP